ncbi:hypothetical protein DIPPA_30813 [Diplonema papillatum]|nr:hypothetical protein DIPPA_30813 [Diplonema papillatum]
MGACSTRERCDKCDGRHETNDCTAYPKPREEHPDAQPHTPAKKDRKDVFIKHGQVIRQPADNHCLYHALCYGLRGQRTPATLRRELSSWVLDNLDLPVKGRKLSEWLHEEYPSEDPEQYAELMKSTMRWGGLPELTGCAIMHKVHIRVWERKHIGFRLLTHISPEREPTGGGPSAFDVRADEETRGKTESTIDVLYNRSRSHYDSLMLPLACELYRPLPPKHALENYPASNNSSDSSWTPYKLDFRNASPKSPGTWQKHISVLL